MTPQEKELIQNVANKLKQSPNKAKDADAEQLINTEIGAQNDAVYKLTQAVLVQEMALKELKQKNEYLEQCVEFQKSEANRSTLSKMMGGSRPAPQPPMPSNQPSAFGSFMQTAASVAVGMVAGNMISNMLFDHDEPAADATAATDTAADAAPAADAATDTAATDTAPADDSATAAADTGDTGGGFLDDSSNSFASDYTDGSSGFGDAGFGDSGFGGGFGDSGFGSDDSFANNGFGDGGFGSDDGGFGGGDDSFFGGGDDFGDEDV
ncbi:DUF2076 domain-containing protein [Photobacterium japonica]|uniref:DUF2076 domain-containing protein n=1 Tax=Photobacterium japonica TaxID=2910235 RepID=UPI003D098777